MNRVFQAGRPNQIWLTDISEHPTSEGKVYLCAIKDTWSNRIVGYSISDRMTSHLAVRALENAIARRGDVAGCIVHSDRGSQFRSRRFVAALARHDMVGSMGRVGAAGDNAAMESFFDMLQKNVLNTRRWTTQEELRIAIVTWIERTYHRRRRQAVLGRLTPIEWETIMNQTVALAALSQLSPIGAAIPFVLLHRLEISEHGKFRLNWRFLAGSARWVDSSEFRARTDRSRALFADHRRVGVGLPRRPRAERRPRAVRAVRCARTGTIRWSW